MTTVTISDSLFSFTTTLPQEDAVGINRTILTELRGRYDDVKIKKNEKIPYKSYLPVPYLEVGILVTVGFALGGLYALVKSKLY